MVMRSRLLIGANCCVRVSHTLLLLSPIVTVCVMVVCRVAVRGQCSCHRCGWRCKQCFMTRRQEGWVRVFGSVETAETWHLRTQQCKCDPSDGDLKNTNVETHNTGRETARALLHDRRSSSRPGRAVREQQACKPHSAGMMGRAREVSQLHAEHVHDEHSTSSTTCNQRQPTAGACRPPHAAVWAVAGAHAAACCSNCLATQQGPCGACVQLCVCVQGGGLVVRAWVTAPLTAAR